MGSSTLQHAALHARAIFAQTEPDTVIPRPFQDDEALDIVAFQVLLAQHRSCPPVSKCGRCGGLLRHLVLPSRTLFLYPMYGCVQCGERIDWQISLNRFLMGIGCSSPSEYLEGYRRVRLAMLEQEWAA